MTWVIIKIIQSKYERNYMHLRTIYSFIFRYFTSHDRNMESTNGEKQKCNRTKKDHSCKACEKSFTSKMQLISHERIHTWVKPYTCVICGNKFRENAALVKHIRTHTGVKPYECGFCKKTFRYSDNLA